MALELKRNVAGFRTIHRIINFSKCGNSSHVIDVVGRLIVKKRPALLLKSNAKL